MKFTFAIAALVASTSALDRFTPSVMPVLTDNGYVLMQTEAAVKLGVATKDYDKPSDYLCDGDDADDKEVLDAADPEDGIVEDWGFSGSRNARGQQRMG